MNTGKQINVIVVLVFLSLFATGAYTLWDPERQETGEEVQLEHTLERAAYLFQNNCRACHGDAGEGGAASNRLRLAPPLNRPDLQGRDAEGVVDPIDLSDDYKLVFYTITCGRVGKVMPAWAQRQGGSLNDEQIKQLTIFITEGGTVIGEDENGEAITSWTIAAEQALEHDEANSVGIHLDEAVTADDTVFEVSKVDTLGVGGRLRMDDEILIIEEIVKDEDPAVSGTVTVERGFGTTNAADYDQGHEVLTTVAPPDPPATTEQSCGQTAGAAGPTPTPAPPSAALSITAKGTAWSTEVLNGLPGVDLTISVNNQDTENHNWAVYDGEDATGDPIAATEIEGGPIEQSLTFGPLDAGAYYYQCDVHPQMSGTLNVGDAAAAPAEGDDVNPAEGDDATTGGDDAAAGDATPEATPSP